MLAPLPHKQSPKRQSHTEGPSPLSDAPRGAGAAGYAAGRAALRPDATGYEDQRAALRPEADGGGVDGSFAFTRGHRPTPETSGRSTSSQAEATPQNAPLDAPPMLGFNDKPEATRQQVGALGTIGVKTSLNSAFTSLDNANDFIGTLERSIDKFFVLQSSLESGWLGVTDAMRRKTASEFSQVVAQLKIMASIMASFTGLVGGSASALKWLMSMEKAGGQVKKLPTLDQPMPSDPKLNAIVKQVNRLTNASISVAKEQIEFGFAASRSWSRSGATHASNAAATLHVMKKYRIPLVGGGGLRDSIQKLDKQLAKIRRRITKLAMLMGAHGTSKAEWLKPGTRSRKEMDDFIQVFSHPKNRGKRKKISVFNEKWVKTVTFTGTVATSPLYSERQYAAHVYEMSQSKHFESFVLVPHGEQLYGTPRGKEQGWYPMADMLGLRTRTLQNKHGSYYDISKGASLGLHGALECKGRQNYEVKLKSKKDSDVDTIKSDPMSHEYEDWERTSTFRNFIPSAGLPRTGSSGPYGTNKKSVNGCYRNGRYYPYRWITKLRERAIHLSERSS